jgi:hypothetical protein
MCYTGYSLQRESARISFLSMLTIMLQGQAQVRFKLLHFPPIQ